MSLKSTNVTRSEFLRSDKAVQLKEELREMADSPLYNTKIAALVEADTAYFVEKHIKYMSNHLSMDHFQYVQNLKLMTKIRR